MPRTRKKPSMGSLDDAIQAAERKSGHRSQLELVLEQLDPDDAKQLLEVYLPDRRYSAPQIMRALASLGLSLSRSSIADWRAKNVPR